MNSMQIPLFLLEGGEIFGHFAVFWGAIVLTGMCAVAVTGFAWFAASLWMVEDGIPRNRVRVALLGALVAMFFVAVSAADYMCGAWKTQSSSQRRD